MIVFDGVPAVSAAEERERKAGFAGRRRLLRDAEGRELAQTRRLQSGVDPDARRVGREWWCSARLAEYGGDRCDDVAVSAGASHLAVARVVEEEELLW